MSDASSRPEPGGAAGGEVEGSRLPPPADVSALAAAVGEENVLTGSEDRLARATGMSYSDLIRRRLGLIEHAPDAVVCPADVGQVHRVLEICTAERIAVVPFGGGSSVVGGVEPLAPGFDRVIALDLTRMRKVEVDPRSATARLGPGLPATEAEAALNAHGFTLGHFPQSFELATIGGFAATRSAGQASAGYGRFDKLVTSIDLVAPAGELKTLSTPHTAAGPALRELIVGSEGTLGVITEVGVRLRPKPEARHYTGWVLPDFAGGTELLRSLAQAETVPDVLRLSDEAETQVALNMSGTGSRAKRVLDAYLRLRKRDKGCLLITGYEGTRASISRRRAQVEPAVRAASAVALGKPAGAAWLKNRYHAPKQREALLDQNTFVETLETAHTWARLPNLYKAVQAAIQEALQAQGTPGATLCHISHVYPDGASLYFTFIAPQKPGEELAQWRAVKTAASEAIVNQGGTITHHHAVGRDHAPYLSREIGDLGIEALKALKDRLDPAGIMNPGKLLA